MDKKIGSCKKKKSVLTSYKTEAMMNKKTAGSSKKKKKKEETDGDGRWSNNLTDQLKEMISRRLDVFGNICLSSVSVSWRRFILENQRPCLPWLLFSCTPQNQVCAQTSCFFNLTDSKIYDVKIPQANARGARLCYGSSDGWVFMLKEKLKRCFLLNPFSRAQVKLPNPHSIRGFPLDQRFFRNVILSSSPSSEDCIVVALNKIDDHPLVFCRPGDKSWTAVSFLDIEFISSGSSLSGYDTVFYRGQLHLDTNNGYFTTGHCFIDFAGRKPETTKCNFIEPKLERIGSNYDKKYLVESHGSLLMIYRFWRQDHSYSGPGCSMLTFRFVVFKLEETNNDDNNDDDDLPSGAWVKQSRLEGDQAVFLGRGCSISLSAAKYPGMKANSIYFADDWRPNENIHLSEPYPMPVAPDIGIYHLEDDRIDHYLPYDSYRPSAPPFWIKPPI